MLTGAQGKLLDIPINGYLDGERGHIHGGYLLAQVALESFCKKVTPVEEEGLLVKSMRVWRSWLADHQQTIRELAVDSQSAELLEKKLSENGPQRPTGSAVSRAFKSWDVKLPADLVAEVKRRNKSAHQFLMFDEKSGDLNEQTARVSKIQTLLAAAIAKYVGYEGALAGWVLDEQGWPIEPEFWSGKDCPESMQRFVCRR